MGKGRPLGQGTGVQVPGEPGLPLAVMEWGRDTLWDKGGCLGGWDWAPSGMGGWKLSSGDHTPPCGSHSVPHSGRCWLDALELALRCSSLLRLSTCKQGGDREPGSSPDASPSSLCGLPPSAATQDQDLFP